MRIWPQSAHVTTAHVHVAAFRVQEDTIGAIIIVIILSLSFIRCKTKIKW